MLQNIINIIFNQFIIYILGPDLALFTSGKDDQTKVNKIEVNFNVFFHFPQTTNRLNNNKRIPAVEQSTQTKKTIKLFLLLKHVISEVIYEVVMKW